jgi:hypoxanthine phosphoribosyltransferase
MHDAEIGEILVQADDLQRRIRELGEEISEDYAGKDLLLVCVLKGAVFFLSDLMRQLHVDCQVDFMAVASYGDATDSSGVVRILKYLLRNLEARRPASLEVCALLTKPERRKAHIDAKYIGFEIPNRFVIGYGLDHAERHRNLPFVAALGSE